MKSHTSLNPQQQQAVTTGLGPVLVLAGPGSGKTRVLTERITYLIGSMGVRPYHILAVTFTNKAAREMEKRVGDQLGEATRGMTLGTFHSICARILRREAEHLPFQSNFVIYDADDQQNLVKRAVLDLNLDEKRHRPAGLHDSISNAKNELLLPDDLPITNYRDEVLRRVYKRYQELLLANNALDFDDLLLWTAYLLEQNPAVREKYSRRYEYILVDEFQDTNLAQYKLLSHLASFHQNIFVVGDADQSIYRWRGADYRNVLRFEKDYPSAQVILLEQNYRSTQTILDAAMAIIDQNPYRTPKRLFTQRGAGEKIRLYEAYDDRVEAAYIVDTILGMVSRQTCTPGDFAVMYRTNAQSRLLEEAFLHAGLPYKLVGAQRFYGRKEIKDVLAYLRLVHNPQDEISLTRAINTPARGIGDKTYLALRTAAQKAELAPGILLQTLASQPDQQILPGRAGALLANFGSLLANWCALKSELPPLGLMDRILQDIEYHAYLDDGSEESQDRWDNVMELRRLASEYQESGLEAFLEQVALVSDQDTLDSGANVPTLLTLHAAKGLEFKVVFLTGLNDGVLPHSRSFDEPEAMMEERRLFYVGITRAKDQLFLAYAQNRSSYGYAEPVEPSRYLEDIPFELIDEVQPRRSGSLKSSARWSSSKTSIFKEVPLKEYDNEKKGDADRQVEPAPPAQRKATPRWEAGAAQSKFQPRQSETSSQPSSPTASPRAAEQPGQPRFPPGTRVQHPTWGEGMVLNCRMQDGDEVLDVWFAGVGQKKLAASIARLEVLR